MNFQEAERLYQNLRQQLAARQITPQQFSLLANNTRVRDAQNNDWQMRANDGAWMIWDGRTWREATPPHRLPPSQSGIPGTAAPPAQQSRMQAQARIKPKPRPPQQPPQSLWQLFLLVLRQILRRLPIMLLLALIIGPVVAVVQYFLMGWVNDGFNTSGRWYLDWILLVRGRSLSGLMLYLALGTALSYFFSLLLQGKLLVTLGNLAKLPVWLSSAMKKNGTLAVSLVLAAGAAGLLFGSIFGNPLLNLQLTLLTFFALLQHEKSLLALTVKLGYSDIRRLLDRPGKPLSISLVLALISGLTAGLAASVLFGISLALNICGGFSAVAVLVVAVVLFFAGKKTPPAQRAGMILMLAAGGLMMVSRRVSADDGGFIEFGGSLIDWMLSPGGIEIFVRSALTGGGFWSGLVIGWGISQIDWNDSEWDSMWETEAEQPVESEEEAPTDEEGGDESLDEDPLHPPDMDGDPDDNPFVHYDGGDGANLCQCDGLAPALCEVVFGLPNYWINTATLQPVLQDTVFGYRTSGPAVRLTITYNRSFKEAGMFGIGWRFAYDSTVQQRGKTVYVQKGSGQRLTFQLNPETKNFPVAAISPQGQNCTLVDYGGYWLYTEKNDQTSYQYEKTAERSTCRLTSIRDRFGNSINLIYNPNDTLHSVKDSAERSVTFAYNDQGRCAAFYTPDGRQASFNYDEKGHLIHTADLLGVETRYEYDDDHSIRCMTYDLDQKTIRFEYCESPYGKHICSVTDPSGAITKYEMVSFEPRIIEIISPVGGSRRIRYDQACMTRLEDPLGVTHQWTYDNGLLTRYQDPNGSCTEFGHDQRGNVIRVKDGRGNVRTYTYNEHDNLVEYTNPLKERLRLQYDESQCLTVIKHPTGDVQLMRYDRLGRLILLEYPHNRKYQIAYDRFSNVSELTHPGGGVVHFEYDPHGFNLTALTNERGNTTRFENDHNRRRTSTIHPDGTSRLEIYGCCSRNALINENGHRTTFRVDPVLNVSERMDHLGNTATRVFDSSGSLVKYIDETGRTTLYEYDLLGQMIKKIMPNGAVQRWEYDRNGYLAALTDALGNAIRFDHDPNGNRTRIVDADGSAVQYSWDAENRLAGYRNARGMSVEYTYDGKQRLTCKAHNGQPAAIYVYDGVDNLLSMRDDSGETQFSYNADGRVTSILYPDGKILRQEYDEAGNLVKIIYPNGLEVNYSYNQREQISRVWWNNQEVLLSYDPAGNLTREERSNGVISVYSFAENEYIQEIKHTRGEKVIASRYLRRDAAGKITAVSGVMPIQPGFTSQSITGSYNRANQVTHLAGEAYHYDADGNLTDIEGKAWQAEYDSENKLVRLSRGDGSWRFVYNGLEQRVGAKTENESQVFYHDKEGRLLCEGGESGQFTACYIYFEDLLGARLISTGESQFYLFDQVGNTIALVNEPGDVCAAYACDPFGLSAGRLEKTHRNPYTFAGRFGVRDEGDGLYYMRYRYYDAHIARFIQKDPMGIVSDSNLYRYTRNNPVNAVDPDGTFGVLEVCLAGLILGAFCAAGYNAAQQVKHTSFGIATQAMRNPHNPNVSPSQGRSSAQRTLEVFGGEPIKTAASLTPGLSSGTAAIRAANEIREGNHVDAALTGVGAGHPNKNVRTGASIVKRVKKIASTCIDARRR